MESELKFTPRRFSDEEIDLLKEIYARVDRMHSSLQKTKEDFKLLKTEPKSLDKVELLEPVLDLKVFVGLGKGDTHGGVVVEEKQNMPLRNFVEQVADQKQEVVMMDSSTENLTTELYYVDYGPLKQKEESIELVVTQIQNTTGKLSYIRMERKNLGVRHISVKRRYHRTRKKKSTSRPDYVQALKSYGMFSGLSLRDRLGNQKAERTHFKRTRSMVNTGCEREVLIVDHGIRRYLKENHGGENMKCLDHVVKISYNDLMIMEVQGDSKSLHQGQMHQGNKLLMPNDENGFDESFNWRNRGLAPRKDVNLHQITSYSVEHEELVSLMFFEKGIKVSIYELGLVTRACQRLKPSQNKGLFKDLGAGTFHLKLYVWDPGQVQLHMGIYGIVFMEKYEQFVSVAHIKQTCVLRETLAENLCVEDWSLSDQVLTITLQLEKATAGVRVGLIRGEFIANLTGKEIKESQLELFSAGTDTATLAREGYRPSTAALSYEVTNKDHHNYQDFIEDATVGKRRFQYEDEVRKTSLGKQILVFSLCSHAWSKIVSRVTQLEGLFSYLFGIEKFSLEVSSGVDLKARIECSWDPGGWCLGQVLWDFREGVSSDSDELRKLCGGPFSVLVLRLKSGRKSMDWDRIGEANKVSEDAQVWKRNAHENEQLDIGQKRVRELAWRNTYYMGKYKLAPDHILSIKVHSLKWEMFLLTNTFIQLEDKLDSLGASNSMWRMMSRDVRKTQSQEEMSEIYLANQVWEPGGKSFKELQLRENGNMEISDHWSVALRSDYKECLLLDVISIAIGECEVDELKTEVKQMQRSQEFFHVGLSRTEKSCGYGKKKVVSSLIKRSISSAIFRKVPCATSFPNNRPRHHDIKFGSKFFLLLFMWSYSHPKKLLTEICIKRENQRRAKRVKVDSVIMGFRSFITKSGFEIMLFCRTIEFVNDLRYLGKSCLIPILRTEKINERAGVVSFTVGKVENTSFLVLTYGRFHSPRPPELSFGEGSANDQIKLMGILVYELFHSQRPPEMSWNKIEWGNYGTSVEANGRSLPLMVNAFAILKWQGTDMIKVQDTELSQSEQGSVESSGCINLEDKVVIHGGSIDRIQVLVIGLILDIIIMLVIKPISV